jgi:hypothetical protein
MTDENRFQRVQWDGDECQASDDDGPDGMPLRPRGAGLSDADVELLTLAARALGAERVEVVEGEQWVNLHFADGSTAWNWNPLRHGDDAFNLSVRLQLIVCNEHVSGGIVYCMQGDRVYGVIRSARSGGDVTPDDYAATRRSIVSAAAEIVADEA